VRVSRPGEIEPSEIEPSEKEPSEIEKNISQVKKE